MNKMQKQERDAKIRSDYQMLFGVRGNKGSVIKTLAVLYNLSPRHIRNIVKEDHDNR